MAFNRSEADSLVLEVETFTLFHRFLLFHLLGKAGFSFLVDLEESSISQFQKALLH